MNPQTQTPAPLEALAELIAVVARLRDPEGGCPWDLAQTHASLVPYVLEEAHEVADAIRNGNDTHLAEELGDLLLQVILHAQIASEAGRFDLEQIVARRERRGFDVSTQQTELASLRARLSRLLAG